MKKLCIISIFFLSYLSCNAQTTSPSTPELLPDTSFSIDQNKSGALYRSPNDSLKRPSAATIHSDSTYPRKAELKDSLFKDPKTVKSKEQSRHVKYSANRKGKSNTRQNASNKKKGASQ